MKNLRKVLSALMVCVTMLSLSIATVMAASVMPRYNNLGSVDSNAWVSSDGELSVKYDYIGTADTTEVVITTTVEKKTLLFFWSDVAEWTDTVYSTTYYDIATLQLGDTGTYRVTVEYTVYGTGGAADTVTHEMEVEY